MFYFMLTDENGIDCVDQVDEYAQDEDSMQRLSESYEDTIYFVVESSW